MLWVFFACLAFAAADQQCIANGGRCRYTSEDPCTGGQYFPGYCNGPSDRQCCITGGGIGDSQCTSRGGECKYTHEGCSGGSFRPGMCQGPANRQCCLPQGPGPNQQCIANGGRCRYTSEDPCTGGQYFPGYCNGPSDRQCCITGGGIGDSQCTSRGGECKYTHEECSGGSFRPGLCQGPANRQCCLPQGPGPSDKQTCESNSNNRIRGQDCSGGGWWLAPRGSRLHRGIDVMCRRNDDVYAPISGRLGLSAPYRRPSPRQRCINTGVRITQSSAREVTLWYVRPDMSKMGRQVQAGEVVARHIGVHCAYRSCMTDHTHLALWRYGRTIDPTPEFGGPIGFSRAVVPQQQPVIDRPGMELDEEDEE